MAMFNRFSIGVKIGCGFLVILIIFLIQSLFFMRSIGDLHQSSEKLSRLTNETITIVELDKKLISLQKDTLVYGQSGSEYVLENIEKKFNEINESLKQILSSTIDSPSLRIVEDMISLAGRYEKHIRSLEREFKYRQDLMHSKLPAIVEEGIRIFKVIRPHAHSEKHMAIEDGLVLWFEISISANEFLKNKSYKYRKEVYAKLDLLEQMKSNDGFSSIEINNLNQVVPQFREIFDQAIQANRNYLSLVNVVMVGESVEFSTLSKKLQERSLALFKEISLKNENLVESNRELILVMLIITLVVIVTMALIFKMNISNSIKGLAESFSSYIDGDFEKEIAGQDRYDEIGLLANAAHEFKVVSENYKNAKNMAIESEKTKSRFLANMSHEIRTPMNGIIGFSTLLLDSELHGEQKENVLLISQSAKSLLVIINDILDFSKIESGKLSIEKITMDYKQVVSDTIQLVQEQTLSKGLDLNFQISEGYPENLLGDPTRLRQILLNLISNAVKFTKEGSIDVNVNFEKVSEKRYLMKTEVVDTGIGMSSAQLEKVFDSFNQADAITTRKYGGTGLGTTISKSLVEIMGGSLSAKSELGKGSNFSFEIPMDVSDEKYVPESQVTAPERNYQKTILVAEDNLINQKVVIKTLTKHGIKVLIANHGEEAMVKAFSEGHDLILMDIQMPVMGGIEATTNLLAEGYSKPIIAMTANVLKEDVENYFKIGFCDVIPKPFNRLDLVDVLDKYLID